MVFKRYLRAARRDPLWMLGWVGGFWLFGTILVLIINATVNDERDYACMGALFSLAGLLPGTLSRGGGSGHVRFRLAVIMGQTRRSFLLWDTVITLLLTGMGLLFSWGLWHVESGLYRLLYPGYADDLPLGLVFNWRVLLLLMVVLAVMTVFFTGITQRYGTKGFGLLWLLLWGGCMVIPSALGSAADGGTSLLARLGSGILQLAGVSPPAFWVVAGVVLLVGLAATGVLSLKKAEVRL